MEFTFKWKGLIMPRYKKEMFIEIVEPTLDLEFLVRIKDLILQDPKRKVYVRPSKREPGLITVYANMPTNYDRDGIAASKLFDRHEVMGF